MKYYLYFGDNCFIVLADKESAVRKADAIGSALLNVSILGELNTMQSEACNINNGEENPVFINKYTIPDYFINLVLRKYNMKIKPFKE